MKQLYAFTKKEGMELFRTGKFLILSIIFVLFGIMNPAMAKLTPALYTMLEKTMSDQGITIKQVPVTALTSWNQYNKNAPIELVILVVMFCGILVNEYQRGTLINIVTKGLSRWKIVTAKYITAVFTWTYCYFLCFGITYGYNAYFWDNHIASHIFFSSIGIYLLGIWLISVLLLASAFLSSNTSVLLLTGVFFIISYLLSTIPTISTYLPTHLLSSGTIMNGVSSPDKFLCAIVVTLISSFIFLIISILGFNKKQL